jgi:hypothetical protein
MRTVLETVSAGSSYFSESFVDIQRGMRRAPFSFDKQLTRRELTVLELAAQMQSDAKIAGSPSDSQFHSTNAGLKVQPPQVLHGKSTPYKMGSLRNSGAMSLLSKFSFLHILGMSVAMTCCTYPRSTAPF